MVRAHDLEALGPALEEGLRAAGVHLVGEGTALHAEPAAEPSAEAELRRSEARFKSLVEAIPAPVFITGLNGLSYGNPAAVELFGYERLEEALGMNPRDVTHPDDVPQLERRAMAMLVEKHTLPPFEYRVFRKDGTLLTIEVSSIPIEFEGQPSILTFARDATDRKRVEAALLQADRLAVLGLLAGGLAHAMNNPLSYVLVDIGQVERALSRGVPGPAELEELTQRLREAHEGALRIAEVVRRMRALSRADEDRRGPVDVRAVLESALELMGNELRHKGELVTRLEEAPPVMASRGRLEHVFLNLLAHAAQSLPESGEGRVELVMRGDSDHVVVEVSDDFGPREPAELARALEPFPTPQEGLRRALCLPLCRSVVEGLGGEMVVDDTQHGMRVRIVLPVSASPEQAREEPGAPVPSAPRAARISRVMVVDDDVAVGSSLRLMLEPEQSITCVRRVQEALEELLTAEPFSLVLCDAACAEELIAGLEPVRPELLAHVVVMARDGAPPAPPGVRCIDKPLDPGALRALVDAAVH